MCRIVFFYGIWVIFSYNIASISCNRIVLSCNCVMSSIHSSACKLYEQILTFRISKNKTIFSNELEKPNGKVEQWITNTISTFKSWSNCFFFNLWILEFFLFLYWRKTTVEQGSMWSKLLSIDSDRVWYS